MKGYQVWFLLAFIAALLYFPSCSRKSGCPVNDADRVHVKTKGDGMPKRKAKSGLFDKKTTKRMKRG